MSAMKDILIQNAEQLGAIIRLKRKEKSLTQSGLAELLGVERKWVLNLERGNPKAELGLVLRALDLLALRASLLDLAKLNGPDRKPARLDEVFQRLQRTDCK
jgi:transcriptional regulator with XRE-family HTH domain